MGKMKNKNTKEPGQITFSIGCPSKEERDSLRKLLKTTAAHEDVRHFDIIKKAVTLYNKEKIK